MTASVCWIIIIQEQTSKRSAWLQLQLECQLSNYRLKFTIFCCLGQGFLRLGAPVTKLFISSWAHESQVLNFALYVIQSVINVL